MEALLPLEKEEKTKLGGIETQVELCQPSQAAIDYSHLPSRAIPCDGHFHGQHNKEIDLADQLVPFLFLGKNKMT